MNVVLFRFSSHTFGLAYIRDYRDRSYYTCKDHGHSDTKWSEDAALTSNAERCSQSVFGFKDLENIVAAHKNSMESLTKSHNIDRLFNFWQLYLCHSFTISVFCWMPDNYIMWSSFKSWPNIQIILRSKENISHFCKYRHRIVFHSVYTENWHTLHYDITTADVNLTHYLKGQRALKHARCRLLSYAEASRHVNVPYFVRNSTKLFHGETYMDIVDIIIQGIGNEYTLFIGRSVWADMIPLWRVPFPQCSIWLQVFNSLCSDKSPTSYLQISCGLEATKLAFKIILSL